jgi:hypothetical protein
MERVKVTPSTDLSNLLSVIYILLLLLLLLMSHVSLSEHEVRLDATLWIFSRVYLLSV